MSKIYRSLGICIGASSIKTTLLSWQNGNYTVEHSSKLIHECNPKTTFFNALEQYKDSYDSICITGRKFKDSIDAISITEPEATEYALKYYLKSQNTPYNALISLGGENFILYELNSSGNIINVQVGNKCASGTGEFFLQQVGRMNVDPAAAISLACESTPYRVSGRCSVFCKSDCTHALNKGIPIGNVAAGLGCMISEKAIELLRSIKPANILLAGGVTNNSYVVSQLQQKITNLQIVEHADFFEAIGAAIYAYEKKLPKAKIVLKEHHHSFTYHPPLKKFIDLVTFKTQAQGIVQSGDICIVGLDVGSTTTKSVLLRASDNKVLASVYLRTNGNPIKAARDCYMEINHQLQNTPVKIVGLGVTGSGRHIAGLHALTDGIINEIIAHATAATYFDPEVDTILEIGGQDAKYTFLVNGVACDYAMNEACSAGTGSFLEEAAKESLNIDYRNIQDIAIEASSPPNFNDQCAAFISSDIKNASHENISRENIVAGLVYSICMNYNNRVKGSRKVGAKIFMQGGVCYNKAVPLAMAAILQKEIIVPPDPGLMGAFGVALEVKNRINLGIINSGDFSLKELIAREVEYGKSFACAGASENCDRKCEINLIKINGKTYPFGGICNKYYNQIHHLEVQKDNFDLVDERQKLVFNVGKCANTNNKSVGILKSYLTNSLFPLYFYFFTELGFKVLLSNEVDSEGTKKVNSSFCFPAEISHGMLAALLKKNPDYIFLPAITEVKVENSESNVRWNQTTCVFVQTESSYLQSAFREIQPKILSPILNFSKGWETQEGKFIEIGAELGVDAEQAKKAYNFAVAKLQDTFTARKDLARKALYEIEKDPDKFGIVLFGRSYNAFALEGNLGIPKKFASRGFYIIPYDCLRFDGEASQENMTWASGQEIIKATRLVKKHPQLFGCYITNFSCGPDSFLVGYFRDIMQTKPSLTLELDSHSADAGINTRIEAFLDIIERYRKLQLKDACSTNFTPASLTQKNKKIFYQSSDGAEISLPSKDVKVLFPSMGKLVSEMAAAVFSGIGYSAEAVSVPNFNTLMIGRSNTSCKECLPLILVTGSLLEKVQKRSSDNELLLYFMPTTSGNCRFSQYYIYLKNLIAKQRIKNIAILSLTTDNGYAGIGALNSIKIIKGIVLADIMDDIRNVILALACDKESALKIFDKAWMSLITLAENSFKGAKNVLAHVALQLRKIKLKTPLAQAKKVIMSGEIYVRRDNFSTDEIVDRLAKKGIVVLRSPILEWVHYIDYITKTQSETKGSWIDNFEFFLRSFVTNTIENKYKKILAASGLYEFEKIDVERIVAYGSKFVPEEFTGETILVIGSFFKDIIKHVHGVISVGPFACLPTRIVESILTPESKAVGNQRINFLPNAESLRKFNTLPFISIECDGNPFPQIIESRIEAFCLQVERVYKTMKNEK